MDKKSQAININGMLSSKRTKDAYTENKHQYLNEQLFTSHYD